MAEELVATGLGGDVHRARAGIVFDYASEWAWQIQPQAHGFSHMAEVWAIYGALRKRGVDIDILSPGTSSFSGYDLVAIPALFSWTEPLRRAVSSYEGHLLVGPRTGSKTETFAIPDRLPPDLGHNLLDVRVARVDSTDPVYTVDVRGGGAVLRWRERLETGAETVLEDEEGLPVLVAQGPLHYQAASGDNALMQRIVDLLVDKTQIPTLKLPASVRCRSRGGLRIYVNYGAGRALLHPEADEVGYLLGTAEMPPAGVTVATLATGDRGP